VTLVFKKNDFFSISQNPSMDEININYSAPTNNSTVQVNVYDINGRAIYYNKSDLSVTTIFYKKIDISILQTGIYIVEVINGDFKYREKIVKL